MQIVTGKEVGRIISDELIKRGIDDDWHKYPKRAIWLYVRQHCYITSVNHVSYFAEIGIRTTIDYWFRKYYTEERL